MGHKSLKLEIRLEISNLIPLLKCLWLEFLQWMLEVTQRQVESILFNIYHSKTDTFSARKHPLSNIFQIGPQ